MSAPAPTAAHGQPLKFLFPSWFAIVMGLAGLSLAWHRATPLMGPTASLAGNAIGVLAALVFVVLVAATLLRRQRYPEAWAEDLKHPLRHVFLAAMPVSVILLATVAVAAGLRGGAVEALWWLGAVGQLFVTLWVMARWWRAPNGLPWASVTPALFIPVVGNVLVPLAGVPLGQPEWAAAQFGIGVFFWLVVSALLVVRLAVQGLWPERLLPASFILVAPPAVIGTAALQFGAPAGLGWGFWGVALFCLLWVLPLLRRIADQPIGLTHWAMTFPLAAFTSLTLRVGADGSLAMAGVAMLALSSLLVGALAVATARGLRDGRLLAPEPVAMMSAAAPT
ncbi:MAG: SLAC1 anion channel family protein [Rubrivivax sp.]|nr:SLAC1 anion channel family protein [Rubrivivax sp.]